MLFRMCGFQNFTTVGCLTSKDTQIFLCGEQSHYWRAVIQLQCDMSYLLQNKLENLLSCGFSSLSLLSLTTHHISPAKSSLMLDITMASLKFDSDKDTFTTANK